MTLGCVSAEPTSISCAGSPSVTVPASRKSLRATGSSGCALHTARCTKPPPPAPICSPTSSSAGATQRGGGSGAARATSGLPARPAHASLGSCQKPRGRSLSRLSARRMSSSSRHCSSESGSASSRLLVSMHLRRDLRQPIEAGSSSSKLSVRMSHSMVGASASSGMCVSRLDLKESMYSRGRLRSTDGIDSNWLPRLKRIRSDERPLVSAGSVERVLSEMSSFVSDASSPICGGSAARPAFLRLRSVSAVSLPADSSRDRAWASSFTLPGAVSTRPRGSWLLGGARPAA
mmetsp:Transcript_19054/g.55022  ORF Transcript_19054/g.55022 Transcript_19054/m.55022 type:complete len:290 (-) Transcript_19054:409-1278(-)